MNRNLNISMTGEEYLAMEKWKKEQHKPFLQGYSKKQKTGLFLIAISLLTATIVGFWIHSIFSTPPTPVEWNFITIIKVLALCLGASWVIHGFQIKLFA